VLVTHDWQDVLRLSSQVYIMEQGRLKHHGPTMELQYQHGDARLNALDARVHGWKPEEQLLMKVENGRVLLTLEGAGWKLQAIITQASTRRLELEPGMVLYALIKSVVVDQARL